MVRSLQTSRRRGRALSHTTGRHRWLGAMSVAGGALICAGVFLPWLTLFAGLQVFNGMNGINGPLFLAGAVAGILGGMVYAARGVEVVRWMIGLAGFGVLAGAGWLLMQLNQTMQLLTADPLLVAQPGPGLFAVCAGGGFLFATLFFPWEL